MELLQHPFVIGLGIGLLVAVVFWFSGLMNRRGLARELRTLREHLQRQMEINQKGVDAKEKELESLRAQNENLRVTNATLKQKPGRAEVRMLTVYDRALAIMNSRAPGFGPAWESAVKDAEAEVAQADTGIMPMLRKVFRPSLSGGGQAGAIEQDSRDHSDERSTSNDARSGSF